MKAVQRNRDGDGGTSERWRMFLGFWLAAAVTLLGLGTATLVALHHGRRIGAALLAVGAACLLIALVVRRAAASGG